jgi:epoxyqueuosine reductase
MSIIKNIENIKFETIPIECLSDIKEDIKQLVQNVDLNGFQKWIMTEQYILDSPHKDFEVRSIVIAVAPLTLVRAAFNYNGITVFDMFDYCSVSTDGILGKLFSDNGYRLDYVHWLPQKRLAVRSGLCEYGRNNITYSDGFGSFLKIATYVSDKPAGEYIWQDVKNMNICDDCGLCIKNCPTGAIIPDRFLIDNSRCLTHQNEWGTSDFPEWIPKSAHHHISGCFMCQNICPKNRERLADISESIDFSEDETAYLLDPKKREPPTGALYDKLSKYNIDPMFESFPRNLKAMFDNVISNKRNEVLS